MRISSDGAALREGSAAACAIACNQQIRLMVQSSALEPCNFCHEVVQAENAKGLNFRESSKAIALPTLGCFVRGYSLVVPREHAASLADISVASRSAIIGFAEEVRERIEFLFGPTIIAEHGSGAPDEPTAACCVHAHLHLIPLQGAVTKVLEEYVSVGGKGVLFEPEEGLGAFVGRSYLTVSPAKGHWLVWPNAARFPRQFVRRAAANALNQPMMFDWHLHSFPENMRLTTDVMKRAFEIVSHDTQ